VSSRRPAPRPGFTLIELLICIAILGILLGLAVPGIMKARELAYRAECANNLHNIGLAALNYQEQKKRLPVAIKMPYAQKAVLPGLADTSGIPPHEMINDSAARIDSDPNYPFGPNWAVYLLEYVGQGPLFREARVTDYMEGWNTKNDALRDRWRKVVQGQIVPLYLCPADVGADTPFQGGGQFYSRCLGSWARGNYAANAGPVWWQLSVDGREFKELYGLSKPVMGANYGADTRLIPDGATRTIMFNEVRIGVSPLDPRGVWAMGYPGSSVTAGNAIGDCTTPNDHNEGSDDVEGGPSFYYPGIGTRDQMGVSQGLLNLGWPSWQAQARSRHFGGVNVCFADGHVQFVSNYVLQGVWFYMLSPVDGVPYSDD
jgi:prepilin-type N-terminal cleavage/methylation domain-containing protein/prepilin-type processing-associated H-X9-DG protein